jgi:hypothetical protein
MARNIAPNITGVALCVGIYDLCVGLWPVVSIDSFTAISGLNSHLDVVRVIGMAWAALGAALLVFCRKTDIVPFLGIASTMAGSTLALAECIFVAMKILPPTFIVQVVCELAIGITWMRLFTQLDGKRVSTRRNGLFNRDRTTV